MDVVSVIGDGLKGFALKGMLQYVCRVWVVCID